MPSRQQQRWLTNSCCSVADSTCFSYEPNISVRLYTSPNMLAALLLPDVALLLLTYLAHSWSITVQLRDERSDPLHPRTKAVCAVREHILRELVPAGFVLRVELLTNFEAVLRSATCVGNSIRSLVTVCSELRALLLLGVQVPLPYSWRLPRLVFTPPFGCHILSEFFRDFLRSANWAAVESSWHPQAPVLPEDSFLRMLVEHAHQNRLRGRPATAPLEDMD